MPPSMTDSTPGGQADSQVLLAEARRRIDAIDEKLLALLNERSNLSLQVGRIKAGEKSNIFKPQRETEILERLGALNQGPLPDKALKSIWREIFSASRSLQRPLRVAYLGPIGTFSYFAGAEYLGHSANFHSCGNIPQIFEEVEAGTCDLGVVPLENSLQGTVGVSFDLFIKHSVVIQAELFSRISHCLLSGGDSLAEIKTVYSHPQALAQCAQWLRAHLPGAGLVPLDSTAAAARRALEEPGTASIGNGNLAEMLRMNILARRIEDEPGNWTRFVVIASEASTKKLGALPSVKGAVPNAFKTSMLFSLQDRPGSLSEVLDLLAQNKVNMRKLESRPLKGHCWRYVFFCDVEQDLLQPEHAELLEHLAATCMNFRILGSYHAGPQMDQSWNPDDTRTASAAPASC